MGDTAIPHDFVDVLEKLVLNKKTAVSDGAARVLVAVQGPAVGANVISHLVTMLRGDPWSHRPYNAAMALAKVGAPAATQRVVNALTHALNSTHSTDAVCNALRDLGRTGALPLILPKLGKMIFAHYRCLGAFGKRVVAASQEAIRALGEMGSLAAEPRIVNRLFGLLRYKSFEVQIAAATALIKIGEFATRPEGVTWVSEVLTRRKPGIAWKVAWNKFVMLEANLIQKLKKFPGDNAWDNLREFVARQRPIFLGYRGSLGVADWAMTLRREAEYEKASAIRAVMKVRQVSATGQIVGALTSVINHGRGPDYVASVQALHRMGFRIFKKGRRSFAALLVAGLGQCDKNTIVWFT
jgi:hypothetical protein